MFESYARRRDIFRVFDSLNYIDNLRFGIDTVCWHANPSTYAPQVPDSPLHVSDAAVLPLLPQNALNRGARLSDHIT